MKRVIEDKDFGYLFITSNVNARNISMRVRPDGLHMTVPAYSDMKQVMKVLSDYRPRLIESFRKVKCVNIDETFIMNSPLFHLVVKREKGKSFFIRRVENGLMEIICPENLDFSSPTAQEILHKAIERAMKIRAQEVLPARVLNLAAKHGMKIKSVKISSAKSRWGSCSSAGIISLSCHLMPLPEHLIDYVILHELTHTKEMNHGPRFWDLLNRMTDGKSQTLRNEMSKYTPGKYIPEK